MGSGLTLLPLGASMLLLLGACGSVAPRWEKSWDAPYGSFTPDEKELFEQARRAHDDGDLPLALGLYDELVRADPENLEVAAWKQEAEIAWLLGGATGDARAPVLAWLATLMQEDAPIDALRREYLEAARDEPSVTSLVLVARLETDALAARVLLEEAIEADPESAWAHYGRAHALLMERALKNRWSLARRALERALTLEPGHLRARRLEAWMSAQEGASPMATAQLERWLLQSEGDARVDQIERRRIELDLALVYVRRGRDADALRILESLEGRSPERGRRFTLIAGTMAEGDPARALDAARRAQAADPEALLPLVQEALLLEHYLDRAEDALAVWRQIVERSSGSPELGSLLQALRGRVELERADLDAEQAVDAAAVGLGRRS